MIDIKDFENVLDIKCINANKKRINLPMLIKLDDIECGYAENDFYIERGKESKNLMFHVLMSGNTFFNIADRHYILNQGDVFIITPGDEHIYHNLNNSKLGYLYASMDITNCLEISNYLKKNRIDVIRSNRSDETVRSLIDTLKYVGENGFEDVYQVSKYCYDIVMNLFQSNNKTKGSIYSNVVNDAIAIIINHIEEEIDLDYLCQRLNVSQSALLKNFKKSLGVTPSQYIKSKKIEHSVNLLKNSTLSCQEIAERLNFCDNAHFSKLFFSYTGITPTNFKKMNKEKVVM